MNNQNRSVDKSKVIAIMTLYVASLLIIVSGVFFSIFSLINNISFQVLNSSVHGAIFGLVVSYLGLRYFFLVKKLKDDVYKTTSRFSWNNFKMPKILKHRKMYPKAGLRGLIK